MNRDYFFRSVSSKLYPILRSEGFKGSGTTLRRIHDPIIHVFNFQASSGGECCYINLGVHLTFLPTEGDQVCDPKKITEPSCSFRERLDPPAGPFGWHYGNSEQEAEESVAMLVEYWRVYSRPFFERFSTYPDDFLRLIEAGVAEPPHPYEARKLARIALQLDRNDLALTLASQALPNVGERATTLRADIQALIKACGVSS